MGEAKKETDGPSEMTEAARKGGTSLAESVKARISPAVEMWDNLIADVIADEFLRERRAKGEVRQPDVVAPGSEPRHPQERTGIPRDDQGQKVLAPRGRLLTIQEAADYLGLSRASPAGPGWRIKTDWD